MIPEFVGGNSDIYYRYSKVAGSSVSNRISEAVKGSKDATTTETNGQTTTVAATLKKLIYKASTDATDIADLAKLVFPTGETLDDYKASDNQNGVIILENDTAEGAAEDALGTITKTGDYEKNAAGTVTNQGVNVYRFSFWDSTTGCTVGDNSQWCVLNITMKQDIYDGTAPVGKLEPFFWNGTGSGNSSVVYNSDGKILGHIELPDDLPARFTDGGSNEFDRDPKVSGQIIVKGNATDENRIGSFTVTFENVSATATFTASSKTWDVTYKKGTAESTAAETGLSLSLDSPTTAIPTQTNHSADWTMTVDTTKVLNNAVAGVNKVITISVTDAAGNGNPAYNSGSAVHNTKDSDKEPYYKVDIVPYITDVTTPDRTNSGLKDNNIRSASGKYSVIKGSTSDFIEVRGFNLNPGANDVRIVSSSVVTGIGIDASNGTAVTRSTAASDTNGYTLFKLSNALTKSGYLEVFTDGVRSLNNINKNDAHDASGTGSEIGNDVTDWKDYYNREADYNTTKNVRLTDDRYIRVFDMKDTGSTTKNGYYPTMIMEDDNPVFGYLNQSGGRNTNVADGGAGKNRAAYAMAQRAKFDASGSELYTEHLAKNSVGDQMGMARDDGGRFHHLSVFDRDQCAMYYVYDRYAELYSGGSGWAPGVTIGEETYDSWDYAVNDDNNCLSLDTVNYSSLMTGRYKYPKMVAKGNSKDGTASVYITYYDDNTHELIMRDFMVGAASTDYSTLTKDYDNISFTYKTRIGNQNNRNGFQTTSTTTSYGRNIYVVINGNYYLMTRNEYSSGSWGGTTNYYYTFSKYDGTDDFNSNIYTGTPVKVLSGNTSSSLNALYSGGTDNNGDAFEQYVNFDENGPYYYVGYPGDTDYDTGRLSILDSGKKGSKFYDMKVTSDNHIVVVYYDEEASRLKLLYSEGRIIGSNPESDISWKSANVSFPEYVGNYVSLDLDKDDGIHIAAFDANDSDLYYMYLSWVSDEEKPGSDLKEERIDQYGSVGHWTQVRVDKTHTASDYFNKPVIAYYNSTETGGHDSIKLAVANATVGNTSAGVDSTGYTTGAWEYMTVPALTPPQGGDPKFQNVCLDFDSSGIPVVGYLGTNLEFGKWLAE